MRFFATLCSVVLFLGNPVAASAPLVANSGFEKPAIHLVQRRTYITGPRGGCYYINRNGNRTYVDRSLCRR